MEAWCRGMVEQKGEARLKDEENGSASGRDYPDDGL